MEQLLAEDIQEEVPLLAKFAATDKALSTVDSTALQLFKPSAQSGASLKEMQSELHHWQGVERLSLAIQKIQRETEGVCAADVCVCVRERESACVHMCAHVCVCVLFHTHGTVLLIQRTQSPCGHRVVPGGIFHGSTV